MCVSITISVEISDTSTYIEQFAVELFNTVAYIEHGWSRYIEHINVCIEHVRGRRTQHGNTYRTYVRVEVLYLQYFMATLPVGGVT